jgi:hypothetical protein
MPPRRNSVQRETCHIAGHSLDGRNWDDIYISRARTMILLVAEIECREKTAEGKVRPPSIGARTYDMTNSFRPMPG